VDPHNPTNHRTALAVRITRGSALLPSRASTAIFSLGERILCETPRCNAASQAERAAIAPWGMSLYSHSLSRREYSYPHSLPAIILLLTCAQRLTFYLRVAPMACIAIPCAGRRNLVVNRVEARGTKRLCPDSATPTIACQAVRIRGVLTRQGCQKFTIYLDGRL
jgi:hypothetical protein